MSLATVPPSVMAMPTLTTTFFPKATTCIENHLTALPDKQGELWMNAPIPVPGTTFSDCYPSQFMSSYLLAASSTSQPAFASLVCPQSYSTVGVYTSNYIACCPSGYTWAEPTSAVPDRPAFGGTCYTTLPSGTPVTVTAYGQGGAASTTTFQPTVTDAKAFAHPLDGYAYKAVQATNAPTTGIIAAPGAKPTPGIPDRPNGSTHTIIAAAGPSFVPSSINANVGDEVIFKFLDGNHTITQSTYDKPCEKIAAGLDSGYMAGHGDIADVFSLTVKTSSSAWFFSQQAGECSKGMVFALNPIYGQSLEDFQQKAISGGGSLPSSGSNTGLSRAVIVGVIVSSIAGSILLISLVMLFCWQYKRRLAAQREIQRCNDYTYDRKNNSNSSCSGNLGTINSNIRIDSWNAAPAVPPKDRKELYGCSTPMKMPVEKFPPAELYGSEAFVFESEEKEMGIVNKNRNTFDRPPTFNDYDVPSSPWASELDRIPETPPLRAGRMQRHEGFASRDLASPTTNLGSPHVYGGNFL